MRMSKAPHRSLTCSSGPVSPIANSSGLPVDSNACSDSFSSRIRPSTSAMIALSAFPVGSLLLPASFKQASFNRL